MSKVTASYYPTFVNQRVANMQCAGDVDTNGTYRVEFGAPVAASATAIVATQAITTTLGLQAITGLPKAVDSIAKWGRGLVVVASAANTAVIRVNGRDYLNQPVSEQFTLNGTTPVVGKKAFAYVDSVYLVTAGSANNLSIGTTDVLGLPYATKAVLASYENGATTTAHTLVTHVDTQTATSGDPRGTIDPNSALDGTKTFGGLFSADIDANNLHGVAHYAA